MSKEKKSSTENASVEITQEMIQKHGLVFMADFDKLKKGKPLYAGLCEYLGATKITPLFHTAEAAKDFMELSHKHIPELDDVQVKICKLSLV